MTNQVQDFSQFLYQLTQKIMENSSVEELTKEYPHILKKPFLKIIFAVYKTQFMKEDSEENLLFIDNTNQMIGDFLELLDEYEALSITDKLLNKVNQKAKETVRKKEQE